ncbi:MAG TPA: palindromic element RPE4 domain-containing protein [Rickettsia endosymbiont of Omalisus fontisbellaquei]|nr:palindromic element RPE4 domain-containing protein [Rickettsia endosymbiont of Omalisus fontisbellaquei]
MFNCFLDTAVKPRYDTQFIY